MDIVRLIVLLAIASGFGYCGGKPHGYHKLLKSVGIELEEKN